MCGRGDKYIRSLYKVSRLEIQQRERLARPEKVLLVFLLVKIKTKLGITVILYLLIADMLTG